MRIGFAFHAARAENRPARPETGTMVWIESQTGFVISVVVFFFCYSVAAIILAAVVFVSRWRFGRSLKAATPGILSPLGTIAGLLIAFLAVRVWTNIDHTTAAMTQQGSAIRQSVLLADTLPAETRAAVRADIKTYMNYINATDWPAMVRGNASSRPLPPGLTDAIRALLGFVPTTPGQHIAQERGIIALEDALAARRDLVHLSEQSIAPIQWIVIFALDVLILLVLAVVHMDSRSASAASMLALSTAFAVTLILLMIYDRPFATGGITLQALEREITVNGI
jgi:hypothetical protein